MKGSKKKSRGYHPLASLELESSNQYQYQNFQSRSRLDARLWLNCRLALVKCLVDRVQGMGVIGSKCVGGFTPGGGKWANCGLALVVCLMEGVLGMGVIGRKCVGGFTLGGGG